MVETETKLFTVRLQITDYDFLNKEIKELAYMFNITKGKALIKILNDYKKNPYRIAINLNVLRKQLDNIKDEINYSIGEIDKKVESK